ncbi:hypothetical protein RRG08_035130 [Elysia crispata]|uniref:Uncharacterized protein n=1 Tax=Elysia crispata TaxID=231223 RepID=A0AAE1E0U8_9GAST|nr:hypothetical protein RRG08_035130 [Elysia crispata]
MSGSILSKPCDKNLQRTCMGRQLSRTVAHWETEKTNLQRTCMGRQLSRTVAHWETEKNKRDAEKKLENLNVETEKYDSWRKKAQRQPKSFAMNFQRNGTFFISMEQNFYGATDAPGGRSNTSRLPAAHAHSDCSDILQMAERRTETMGLRNGAQNLTAGDVGCDVTRTPPDRPGEWNTCQLPVISGVQSSPRDCFYDVLCRTRLHARKLAVSRESPELAEVTTRELRNLRVEETLDGRGKSYITHGGSCANFGGCEAFCRSNYDVESKGGRSLQEVTVAGNWFTRQHATFARAPLPGVIGHVTAIRPWPLKGDNPGGEMSGLELSFLFVSPLEIAGGLTQYTQPSCVPESHGLHRLSR